MKKLQEDKVILLVMLVALPQVWITAASECGLAPNVTLNCSNGSAHVEWVASIPACQYTCKAQWACVNSTYTHKEESSDLSCDNAWDFSIPWDHYFCNVTVFYKYDITVFESATSPPTTENCSQDSSTNETASTQLSMVTPTSSIIMTSTSINMVTATPDECGLAPSVTLNCNNASAHVEWAASQPGCQYDCTARWTCVNGTTSYLDESSIFSCNNAWNFIIPWDYYFCNVTVFYMYHDLATQRNMISPETTKSCSGNSSIDIIPTQANMMTSTPIITSTSIDMMITNTPVGSHEGSCSITVAAIIMASIIAVITVE